MATTLDEINDLFMQLITDYRLNSLYTTSGSNVFNTYLEPWLRFSINEFSPTCAETLVYSTTTQTFSTTLSEDVILILSQIMVKWWLQKLVNDVLQVNLAITDRDFKHYSESQNLREKRDLLNQKKEEISQLLVDYSIKHNNWSNWNLQTFGG
jgi:hypothetical protein